MFSITPDFLLLAEFMLIQMIFLYIITRYNSGHIQCENDIDVLFKEKKTHEKWSMARLYSKMTKEIRNLAINHKKTVRNFHKKLTKNPKDDMLDSLKLWVSK